MKYVVSLLVVFFLLAGNSFAQDKAAKDRHEREQMREVGRDSEAEAADKGDQEFGTRKRSSGVSGDVGTGYSAGANKGKKLTGDVDANEAAGRTGRSSEADTKKRGSSVSSGGEGYKAGMNKGKRLTGDVDANEAAGRTGRSSDAGTKGSARGGAVSSGASSDEGAAVQSSEGSSGLLRNKKQGTATSISVGKGENKAKKADAIDDQAGDNVKSKPNPVGD